MSIVKSIKALGGTAIGIEPLNPQTYRSLMSDLFLPGGQGPTQQFTYSDNNSSLTAYQSCPPFTAVINKLAKNYVNGKTWVMDIKKGKESQSPFANILRQRLGRPNPLQTWSEFEAQQDIFINLFGWCPLLPIIPLGFKDVKDATSWWNIPTCICEPVENNSKWYNATSLSGIVDSIKIRYKNEVSELPMDKIFIFRDFVPSFQSMAFPDSRVRSLELPINNIIGAFKSRNVLINYRGALGIISSESDKSGYIPIKPNDKEDLQRDFLRHGLLSNQWKFIITSAAVKWQQIGIPTRELMLFEEIQDDIYRICDAYDFPSPLMASDKNNALGGSNQAPAMASLYQNAIIPTSISRYEQWNNFLKCTDNGVRMEKDYSHIPALQANKVEEGRARLYDNQGYLIMWQQNLITANQWLEALGMDTVNGFDVYFHQWSAQGLSFGGAPAPVQVAPITAETPPNEGDNINTTG